MLENFKGRTMAFDFSEHTILRGTNEAGKSTLANAFFWLILGVDSQNRTNYDLYDSTKEYTPENAIPAVVEGVFDVDGVEYVFKKTAKQKWTRPRGKSEYVKAKSDEYMFYIDSLAVSANIYKERIESIFAPIDKLKLMLNVRYYQSIDWKELRKHFADIIGEITAGELSGDYSSISPLLAKYEEDPTFKGSAVEAVKEKLKQDMTPLKKSHESLESEIKGMKDMLPDTSGVEAAEALIAEKQKRISEIDREIIGLGEANKPYVEKRKSEEALIEAKIAEIETCRKEWNAANDAKLKAIKDEIAHVDEANADILKKNTDNAKYLSSLNAQIEAAKLQAQFLSEELDRLRKENAEIKARTFDDNQVCQTCGQHLPSDMIADIRELFYAQRERDHKACVDKGIRTKNSLENQNKIIESLEKQASEVLTDLPLFSKANLEKELAYLEESLVPFEHTERCINLHKELDLMEESLTVVPAVNSADLIAEKSIINSEIKELQAVVATKSERERGEKRIQSKENERAGIGVALARLEGLYDKCVEREREWAAVVRDRANKYLDYAHVEMVEISKAGEINDICTLTARSVGCGGTNTATQVLIGVDVARAFQKNAGLELPIIIDNAEQIVESNMPKLSNQLIAFYVDEKYSQLTVC